MAAGRAPDGLACVCVCVSSSLWENAYSADSEVCSLLYLITRGLTQLRLLQAQSVLGVGSVCILICNAHEICF